MSKKREKLTPGLAFNKWTAIVALAVAGGLFSVAEDVLEDVNKSAFVGTSLAGLVGYLIADELAHSANRKYLDRNGNRPDLA